MPLLPASLASAVRLSLHSFNMSNKGEGVKKSSQGKLFHTGERLPTQKPELHMGNSQSQIPEPFPLLSALQRHLYLWQCKHGVREQAVGNAITTGPVPMNLSGRYPLSRYGRGSGCAGWGPNELGPVPPTPEGAIRQEKAPACYRKAAPQLVWVAKHLGKMPVLPLQRPSSQSLFTGKHKGAGMSSGPYEWGLVRVFMAAI